jgi:8-oxo-dGTP pyrophosphatase MutT (NUDIX family)
MNAVPPLPPATPSAAAPAPEPDGVRLLERSVLHRGPLLTLVREHIELPSGRRQLLELVEHPGAVAIAALDGRGRLACVRQYRRAAREVLVEIPAGRVERDESRVAAAARELEEETGLLAAHFEVLADFFPAPGFCDERLTVYLATGLRSAGARALAPDADEELSTVYLTPRELLDLPCRDGKSLVAAGLLLARAAARP